MILGHINVRYRRPVEQPDTIIIGQGAVMPMERNDRFVLRSTAYSLKQRTIVASADQLCVTYDYMTKSVTSVPDDIKNKLMQNSLPIK
jgi:acyl-CoA thioesterase FadM